MKLRAILSTLTAIGTTLAMVSAAAADTAPSSGNGWSGEHPMMWSGMFMGPITMILMIVVLAVAVVLVFKFLGIGVGGSAKANQDNALTILNERFAKGEIDKAEYEERKKALGT
jgi:putative membrane protein